jgi:hypothetical protein
VIAIRPLGLAKITHLHTITTYVESDAARTSMEINQKGTGFKGLKGGEHPSRCMYFARTSRILITKKLKAFDGSKELNANGDYE